ncbi:MAG: SIMPL domain-containing protein, partial [Verrucomicrobiales bacterium]
MISPDQPPARTLVLVLAFTSVLAIAPLGAAESGQGAVERTISVSGEGTVTAVPDIAFVSTGVVTEAATAGEALAANTEAMEAVMAALEGQGIEKRDIQTSNFSVQPQYERIQRAPNHQGEQKPPSVIGYRVSNNVRVKARDLDRLGELLDVLVGAGSNQISGVSFAIDDPESLMAEAREAAIDNARERA